MAFPCHVRFWSRQTRLRWVRVPQGLLEMRGQPFFTGRRVAIDRCGRRVQVVWVGLVLLVFVEHNP